MTTTEKEAYKIAKREKRAIAQAHELDQQAELFREINARAEAAGRKAPYPNVEMTVMTMQVVKRDDGTFAVSKREKPLDEIDWDLSGHHASVVSSRSYSERWAVNPTKKPLGQKYGDAGRLEAGGDHANDALSIEPKEVAGVGCACL